MSKTKKKEDFELKNSHIPMKEQFENRKKVKIYSIAYKMKKEGLSDNFIAEAVKFSEYYEGAYDLLILWEEEKDQQVKEEIITALYEEIEEYHLQPKEPLKLPNISRESLERIHDDVITFKSYLRNLVDKWGGVNKLSKATGIPQPSLSYFFKSATKPRKTTLYKIAEALELTEDELSSWAS